jgi:hypothetical protein
MGNHVNLHGKTPNSYHTFSQNNIRKHVDHKLKKYILTEQQLIHASDDTARNNQQKEQVNHRSRRHTRRRTHRLRRTRRRTRRRS